MRILQPPFAGLDGVTDVITIEQGGTNATTAPVAVANLGGISNSQIGQLGGPVPIGLDGKIDISFFDLVSGSTVCLIGPDALSADQVGIFTITNFDSFKSYSVSATIGDVVRTDDTITYTAPSYTGLAGFELNGRTINVDIVNTNIAIPTITNPISGSTVLENTLTVTTSPFIVTGSTDVHLSSDWQIATDIGFNNIEQELTDSATSKTEWLVSGLIGNTLYYVRARHRGTVLGLSSWSSTISFLTDNFPAVNQPSMMSPANGSTDLALVITLTGSAFSDTVGDDTHHGTDWQIATDVGFNSIVKNVVNTTANKLSVSSGVLTGYVTYYARVRYKGNLYGYSPWSTPISFTTMASAYVDKPSILTPVESVSASFTNLTFTSSNFNVTGGSDSPTSEHWQIATDAGFNNIVQENNTHANDTSWIITGLTGNTQYHARVRKQGVVLGYSVWSDTKVISTGAAAVSTPYWTDISGSPLVNVPRSVTFTASAFSSPAAGLHLATDWQLCAVGTNYATVVQQSLNDTVNKTSWPVANLSANTVYVRRVRYKCSILGWSAWSSIVNNTVQTRSSFLPINEIGIINIVDANLKIQSQKFGNVCAISNDGSVVASTMLRINGMSGLIGVQINKRNLSNIWVRQTLLAATPEVGAYYSTQDVAVAISGDGLTVAIATNLITIYKYNGSTWVLDQTISLYAYANLAIANNTLFTAIDINDDGTYLAFTIPQITSNANICVVYSRTTGSWVENASIPKGGTGIGSYYGTSISINGLGDRLAVKEEASANGGGYDTTINIYKRVGSTWTSESEFVYNNLHRSVLIASNGFYCRDLQLSNDGSKLISGFTANTFVTPVGTTLLSTGSARVYSRSGTTWSLDTTLALPTPGAGDYFGYCVTISDTGLAAVTTNTQFVAGKKIYLYLNTSGTTWTPVHTVNASYQPNFVRLSNDGQVLIASNIAVGPNLLQGPDVGYQPTDDEAYGKVTVYN